MYQICIRAWTLDHTERGSDFEIPVYRRCGNNQKTMLHRFYTSGNYKLL
ncbi:MAG: hypothetical protein ACJAUQ_001640 [Maribacter sp.]|jgi:hypothetical protein